MANSANLNKIGGLVADDIRTSGVRSRMQAKKTLARVIRNRLRALNMTPAELARKAGLSRDNVSTYMRESSLPSPDSLSLLARGLDMKPDELMPDRHDATYSSLDGPTIEITATPSQPGKAWLRVEQLVNLSTATKVAELLQSETANDDSHTNDGKRGR